MTAGARQPAPRTPFADRRARVAAGTHGLRLFLVSLGMLFAASLIGYLVVRLGPAAGGTRDRLPPLPPWLWLSTAMLLASSGTMHLALRGARSDRPGQVRAAMAATTLLGLGFLAVQGLCWAQWSGPLARSLAGAEERFLLTAFYVLTGLHAAHVAGGLVPLTVVTGRAFAGRYTGADHAGVLYCGMYWHFLDGVWLALFATLMIGTR